MLVMQLFAVPIELTRQPSNPTWTQFATAWALVRMRRDDRGAMTKPLAVLLVWVCICHGVA